MPWDGPSTPPAPRRVHPGDRSACTRPADACIAQRCWSVSAYSVSAAQHSGADQRVHEQEVVERPALVAGATSRAQAVNFMAEGDGCSLLGVPAQHRCTTAATAQHSTAAC